MTVEEGSVRRLDKASGKQSGKQREKQGEKQRVRQGVPKTEKYEIKDESGELEEFEDDEEIDPNEETLHVDTDDDLLEFEDSPIGSPSSPHAPRSSGPSISSGASRAFMKADDDWNEDDFEVYTYNPSTAYVIRWCAAQLGFLAALLAYAGVQWRYPDYAWTQILVNSQFPLMELYLTAFGGIWLLAIVLAAILARFDRSAIRCFQFGIAWAAIAIIAVTALSVQQPAQLRGDDRFHVAAAMLHIALAPSIHAYAYGYKGRVTVVDK